MKTFQIKAFACFLAIITIFAACEQEALIPTTIPNNTVTNLPVGILHESEGNEIPHNCGGIHTTESLLHSDKITQLAKSNKGVISDRSATTFSVQFHVIRSSNGTGGTTEAIIDERLEQLNEAFASSNIQFEKCEDVIFNDNDNWHIPWGYSSNVNDPRSYANTYNVPNVINVSIPISIGYSCCSDCIRGLGTYPDGNPSGTDYISVGLEAFESTPDVFIHEMGHFFGLYHTHENDLFGYEDVNDCNNTGDLCCDTPPDPRLTQYITTSCSPCGWDVASLIDDDCQYVGNQSFTSNGTVFGCSIDYTAQDYSSLFPSATNVSPLTDNYMSYGPSECRNSFTDDQIARVNAAASFPDRANLQCSSSTGGNTQTIEVKVTSSSADAEERVSDGRMNRTSTDLEFGRDYSTDQHIGLRFRNIDIPQGAQICDAYIEFTAKGTTSSNFTVEIAGDDHDDAHNFGDDYHNISDRTKTSARVDWDFGSSTWTTNQIVQSPDISSVVQEIINRGGWDAENEMVFIFETKSGNGTRRVYTYNGSKTKSAKLVVTYGGC